MSFQRAVGEYEHLTGEEFRMHPLANGTESPIVARHRLVCWETLGSPKAHEVATPCWVCGWKLPWRLHPDSGIPSSLAFRHVVNVDHLNGIRGDDRPENLAPSCWWCNANRIWLAEVDSDWMAFLRSYGEVDPNMRPDLRVLVGKDLNTQGVLAALEIDFSPDGPFWNSDETADEWLIPDFVARGRGHALYAGAKTGKSSFVALDAIAAAAIPNHTAWTNLPDGERITVVYLDYEMTEADVRERLEGFGYSKDDDYSQFHYIRAMAFGSDLDTHEGGSELLAYAMARRADLVVVDTMSRAVRGDENDADTVRHFYQSTGGLLKGHGIALLRLDHAGKTAEKGQRGSSGKNDDVDVVWRLERRDDGSELTCTHKRMAWVPDKVTIVNQEADGIVMLRRSASDALWPSGTAAKAAEADAAGLPLDATRQQLKDAGIRGGTTVLAAAVRYRRQRDPLTILSVGQ